MVDGVGEGETRVLKPANENPWYVLMTLYGEQDGEEVNEVVHEENRAAWNTWAAQASPSRRDDSTSVIPDLPSPDAWHTRGAQIRTLFESEFSRRNPQKAMVRCPEPSGNDAIDLKDLEFSNQLCISRFFLPRIARFNGSEFHRRLVAQTAIFVRLASFARCRFGAIVTFQGSKFHQKVDFRNSDFREGLNLQASECVDLALNESRFKDTLLVADASCSGLVNMSLVKPLDSAEWNLSGFQFSAKGSAYFSGTVVKGDVDFRRADFGWNFDAVDLSVSGHSDFGRVRFARDAYFSRSRFAQGVSFFKSTFFDRGYFDGVVFGASAPNALSFQDCSFKEPTTFREAQFAELYPDFSGAILHDKTTFTDQSAYWPKAQEGMTESQVKEAKASCAVIRHSLGKQGLPEAEHFFFRREMGFAGQSGPWWQRPPYWLFGWLSDYGYSILTPLLWLCLLIVGGASVLAWGAAESAPSLDFWQGLGLSFSNAFNFLGFHKTFQTENLMGNLSPTMKAFSGFQTIGGVILLFFVGLGLRTRFRLR